MKQKLITTVAAITFGLLPALAGEPEPEHLFLNAGKIEHITIQNDMEIILLQAPAGERSVIFDEKLSEKLNLRLDNNTLFISGRRHADKQKTIVYLYVNNLKSLTVEGNSQVKTAGALQTGKLDVFIDGFARVHLRTSGYVEAHSLNDAEIAVEYLSGNAVTKRGF